MPVGYSQDRLAYIINVHWGGGAKFVNGGGTQRYLQMDSSTLDPAWQNLGSLDFSSVGTVQASSYAKIGINDDGTGGTPTFLLGGNDYGGDDSHTDNGLIMASRDGLTWSRVLTAETGPQNSFNSASVMGIVWNVAEQRFYAGAHVFRVIEREDHSSYTMDEDVLFRSIDGYHWSEVGRTIWQTGTGDHSIGLLARHCSDKVKDSFGNGVPDGVYGYDVQKDILIAPSVPPAIHYDDGVMRADPKSTVVVTAKGNITTVDVGILVNCVAYAGGIWMAAGGTDPAPMTAYSIDDGMTWTRLTPTAEEEPEQIMTMCVQDAADVDAGL